jgi:Tol biopolymer transport system component
MGRVVSGQPIQVTFNGGGSPTASPDGQWIAYKHLNGGISKIRSDGTQYTQLTDFGMEPDWSGMGNLIVFRSGSSLFALNALSGDTSLIRTGGFDDNPAWSPDGSEIALEGNYGIVIVSYPDGNITDVFCIDPDFSYCEGEGPTWSPDGYWIAFEDGLEILKVPRSGDTATVVVDNINDVSDPSWSPNGEWIAFAREYPSYSDWHVWVTDSRGPQYGLWQVTDGTDMESSPSWSPNSDTIYFSSNRSGQWEVWKVPFNPTTAIDECAHNGPLQYCLYNNYPNPFNNNTSIGFWLAESGDVSLTIYNILGRKVRTLIDEYRLYGNHKYDFNANHLSSGIYFYRLKAGETVETKRMILLK